MTAAGYVGIEPEAALWLAGAMDRAGEGASGTARRLAAMFAEAGEEDLVGPELRRLEAWLQEQAGDVRRRAALATVAPARGVDPTCAAPWTDPLVRAARAVWANARNVATGGWDSTVEGGLAIWQLVPVNTGWSQAWVDLGSGLAAMARDPGAAVVATVNVETLDERGFSYWIGGFVPDAATTLLGGAGAAKVAVRVADKAADAAHAAKLGRLSEVVRRLPHGRGDVDVDVPAYAAPRPRRNWRIERQARAQIRAEDIRARGHSGSRHGPRTSLRSQYVRADTGLTPDGQHRYRIDASRFFRWEDQAEAIRLAKAQWQPGVEKLNIDLNRPVGEGYMKATLQYRRTTVVRVNFDDKGNAYSAFPWLRDGGPLP